MSRPRPWHRLRSAYARRAAKWFARRDFDVLSGRPIVSFTFDDFPKSACHVGAPILESKGLRATYYTALGLVDQCIATGEMFSVTDLPRLLAQNHELGCHTFDHYPSWETAPAEFEASIKRNAAALAQISPDATFRSLSYPISFPRPLTKKNTSRYFDCCRGGGQTFNLGKTDLSYLSAFFLEQSRDNPEAIKATVRANQTAGGWLIFATHDVTEQPSRFGCTPALFEEIVHYVIGTGALVLPVHEALQTIKRRDLPTARE